MRCLNFLVLSFKSHRNVGTIPCFTVEHPTPTAPYFFIYFLKRGGVFSKGKVSFALHGKERG